MAEDVESLVRPLKKRLHVQRRHTQPTKTAGEAIPGPTCPYAGATSPRPGDFLHVPARTPHTFQLTGNNTRFIQFHAPGLNEPFFRYMCDPCEEYTFLQPAPPFRFDRVLAHMDELDVKFL
ncbi:MAG: hypothetical protein IT170_17770 [Bryobacterales bacterium]|nr:hypothetical protein [Bryobacterales bacterium]